MKRNIKEECSNKWGTLLFLERTMESYRNKNVGNKSKHQNDDIWVHVPTYYKNRKCGSGVTFKSKRISQNGGD